MIRGAKRLPFRSLGAFMFPALALLLATAPAEGQEQNLQEQAAEAFANSEWSTAIENYQTLVDRGAVDPELYYNLGTAYARSGDRGRGVWMLLKARQLAPRDADVRHNLKVLAPDVGSQLAVFPFFPLQAIYDLLSLNAWAWMGGGSTAIVGMLLVLLFTLPNGRINRALLKRALSIVVGVALVGHVFASVRYYEENYMARGVIVAEETYPRTLPSETAEAYESAISPGTIIRVGSAGVKGWIKAIYGGRNEVFILREQMEFL